MQQAARRKLYAVCGAVLSLERIAVALAMVVKAGARMQPLMQRAAVRDVQLLHPAADREHRHAGIDRRADQRQRGRIARGIVQRVGRTRRAAVVMRLDVRIAAGQQQPVDGRHDRVDRLPRTQRGQHERQRAGAVDQRDEILLAGRVVRMGAAQDAVGGDGYDRARAHDRLRDKRATRAEAQDDGSPPPPGMRACAIMPRARCGNRQCDPMRKRKRTLG